MFSICRRCYCLPSVWDILANLIWFLFYLVCNSVVDFFPLPIVYISFLIFLYFPCDLLHFPFNPSCACVSCDFVMCLAWCCWCRPRWWTEGKTLRSDGLPSSGGGVPRSAARALQLASLQNPPAGLLEKLPSTVRMRRTKLRSSVLILKLAGGQDDKTHVAQSFASFPRRIPQSASKPVSAINTDGKNPFAF